MIPVFTLSKIKAIYPQMKEITNQLEEYLDSNLNKDIEVNGNTD